MTENSAKNRIPIIIIVISILLLIAVFVWPTRYRYDRMVGANGFQTILRTDRFTGETEYFNPSIGWVAPTPTPSVNPFIPFTK
jgi:hypothetical protein